MEKLKKQILSLVFSLLVLFLAFLFFVPYFTSDFSELREKREEEESRQRILKEELLRKQAEEKIYLTGKFDPSLREDFILVPARSTLLGTTMYLRKETYYAYVEMANAAKLESINLKIASATRNFDYQKGIWEKKWIGATFVEGENLSKSIPDELTRFEKILEYSATPGTSRHHWGTDIDINGAEPRYFDSKKGSREYDWLVKNATRFGFCQTYNLKGSGRIAGYNEEKWHWSYLPLSKDFTKQYKNLVKDEDIIGFLGDKYVPSLHLIDNYVLSINKECL